MATRKAVDRQGLKGLTYYAIDRASPFNLAMHKETDTLEEIEGLKLVDLQITGTGLRILWQTINTYAGNYGGKPVPPTVAIKCKTVGDVWAAVCAAAGINPEE